MYLSLSVLIMWIVHSMSTPCLIVTRNGSPNPSTKSYPYHGLHSGRGSEMPSKLHVHTCYYVQRGNLLQPTQNIPTYGLPAFLISYVMV